MPAADNGEVKTKRKKRGKQPRPTVKVAPKAYGPIRDPNQNDVLCGRGEKIKMHPGNVQFREIVNKTKPEYLAETRKLEKRFFAAQIVERIRAMSPPGRFLKEDFHGGPWFEIGDEEAFTKTGQALREDAPKIRNELKMPVDDDKKGKMTTTKTPSSSSSDSKKENKTSQQQQKHQQKGAHRTNGESISNKSSKSSKKNDNNKSPNSPKKPKNAFMKAFSKIGDTVSSVASVSSSSRSNRRIVSRRGGKIIAQQRNPNVQHYQGGAGPTAIAYDPRGGASTGQILPHPANVKPSKVISSTNNSNSMSPPAVISASAPKNKQHRVMHSNSNNHHNNNQSSQASKANSQTPSDYFMAQQMYMGAMPTKNKKNSDKASEFMSQGVGYGHHGRIPGMGMGTPREIAFGQPFHALNVNEGSAISGMSGMSSVKEGSMLSGVSAVSSLTAGTAAGIRNRDFHQFRDPQMKYSNNYSSSNNNKLNPIALNNLNNLNNLTSPINGSTNNNNHNNNFISPTNSNNFSSVTNGSNFHSPQAANNNFNSPANNSNNHSNNFTSSALDTKDDVTMTGTVNGDTYEDPFEPIQHHPVQPQQQQEQAIQGTMFHENNLQYQQHQHPESYQQQQSAFNGVQQLQQTRGGGLHRSLSDPSLGSFLREDMSIVREDDITFVSGISNVFDNASVRSKKSNISRHMFNNQQARFNEADFDQSVYSTMEISQVSAGFGGISIHSGGNESVYSWRAGSVISGTLDALDLASIT